MVICGKFVTDIGLGEKKNQLTVARCMFTDKLAMEAKPFGVICFDLISITFEGKIVQFNVLSNAYHRQTRPKAQAPWVLRADTSDQNKDMLVVGLEQKMFALSSEMFRISKSLDFLR